MDYICPPFDKMLIMGYVPWVVSSVTKRAAVGKKNVMQSFDLHSENINIGFVSTVGDKRVFEFKKTEKTKMSQCLI